MLLLLSSLIQLIVMAAIVVGITRLVRRHRPSDGTAALRRVFVYGLLAASVSIAAAGVWGLIARALEPAVAAGTGATVLARSLAFTLVGVPSAILLFAATLRRLDSDPQESEAAGWRLYVSAATALSLLGAMISAFAVLVSLLGLDEANGEAVAWLIVSAAVWAVHWMPAVRRHHPPSGVHLSLGTLLGFGTVAGSAGVLIGRALDQLYVALFATELASSDFGDVMTKGSIALVIGAAAWGWHWFRPDRSSWSEAMWHGWVLLGGVLPGVLAVLGSASALLVSVEIWVLGDPGSDSAAVFFEFVPAAMATGLVGGFAAAYHRRAHASSVAGRTEPARAYDYLLAAVGLGATLIGATTLLVAFFGVFGGSVVAGSESSVNILLTAFVAVALGVPLWLRFWQRIEGHAAADPDGELAAPSRRSYVLAVLGISGVVGLISTISVLFLILEDLLESRLGGATLYDMRVPLALMFTVGGTAWFHWNVFRADQERRPSAVAPAKHVVLLAAGNGSFADDLEAAMGAGVDRWDLLEEATSVPFDATSVAAAVAQAAGDDVLVVMRQEGEPLVVSYRTS